jgi:hypothetical protein
MTQTEPLAMRDASPVVATDSLTERAEKLRAAELERAAQAPPARLNYSPGRPPQYGDIGGGASNKFNKERMAELARLLESTADGAVIDFARNLRAALEPPPAPPPPPGAPPLVSPLPPDAAVAAGDPGTSSPGANAYLALADELHKAADDIERRIRQLSVLDEPLPIATTTRSRPRPARTVSTAVVRRFSGSCRAGSGRVATATRCSSMARASRSVTRRSS